MTRADTDERLELSVLQLLRLKGRGTAAAVAEALGGAEDVICAAIAAAVNEGFCAEAGSAVRLTPEGRQRLADLLDLERSGIDQVQLAALYHQFDSANTELKSIIAAWQMRNDQTPNDHTDAEYDASVIDRLTALNDEFAELLGHVVAAVTRLAHYPSRFASAIAKVRAGDRKFVASPVADSYHQVWFELHEELIGLLGRTRAEEAAAGRAV